MLKKLCRYGSHCDYSVQILAFWFLKGVIYWWRLLNSPPNICTVLEQSWSSHTWVLQTRRASFRTSWGTLLTAPWPQDSIPVWRTDQKHPQFLGTPEEKNYKNVLNAFNGRFSVSWEQLNNVLWVPLQFCLNISAPLSLLIVSILTNKHGFPQSFDSTQIPPTDLHSHPTQMLVPFLILVKNVDRF